jgi:hypothetical protein
VEFSNGGLVDTVSVLLNPGFANTLSVFAGPRFGRLAASRLGETGTKLCGWK